MKYVRPPSQHPPFPRFLLASSSFLWGCRSEMGRWAGFGVELVLCQGKGVLKEGRSAEFSPRNGVGSAENVMCGGEIWAFLLWTPRWARAS